MSRRSDLLERLGAHGVLRPFDVEIGRCLLDLDADADPALGLLAASVALAVSQGHSCLPLAQLGEVLGEACPQSVSLPELPSTAQLQQALHGSRLAAPANEQATAPLLYDRADRVYLGRYFHYERRVAELLRVRTAQDADRLDPATLRAVLQPFFDLHGDAADWQAIAALTGLVSPLTVITGGPGTGKTTTVLWLLAAWIALRVRCKLPAPRIHLAAPTGKAAARLSETLQQRVAGLEVDAHVRAAIPQTASTLHRLLGVRLGSTHFRHHAAHPLATDLVVVDEASMVDLPLMAKLLDAMPAEARLVLLGDRDQLASVEAGNVLAAICAAAGELMSPARARMADAVTGWSVPHGTQAAPLADAVVSLQHSHRFASASGLGRLAAQIRAGDADAVCTGLADAAFPGVELDTESALRAVDALLASELEGFAALAGCGDPAQALAQSAQRRILTAVRQGPSGSETLNAAFDRALRQRARLDANDPWYAGRLLMVTRNDYATELFNGDIGIVLADADDVLYAWFPAADGGVRKLALASLPDCESAYAMTIHKSQGSEFDEVVIVLPNEDARVLGRELLYTAVTRARRKLRLVATNESLARTIERSRRRHSGLADQLGQIDG